MASFFLCLGCSMVLSMAMGFSIAAYEVRQPGTPPKQRAAPRRTRAVSVTRAAHPIARRRRFA